MCQLFAFSPSLSPRFVRWAVVCTSLLLGSAAPALAGPALDLSARLTVDGFSSDFDSTETVFGVNETFVRNGQPCVPNGAPACPPEESLNDSQWGFFNDVNQVHLSWDKRFLYVAVDGITWDNNLMIFFDVTRRNRTDLGPGLSDMVNVNSWRRNITFTNGFEPDFFLATWDRNAVPQLWNYDHRRSVVQQPTGSFATAATFSSNAEGRAMEAAIPWSVVFQRDSVQVNPAYADTVPLIPAGFDTLRLVACVTAGGDGTGSPDSAPDNFSGFQVDGNAPATLDNFVIIPFDLLDAAGQAQPDGVPDLPGAGQTFSVRVSDRVTFLQRPPIRGISFSLSKISIQQGVVSPEQGRDLLFRIELDQHLATDEAQGRTVSLTAEVYDMRGVRKRVLYSALRVPVLDVPQLAENHWDGRDTEGRLVDGGVYILRVLVEPNLDQAQRSFAVVR